MGLPASAYQTFGIVAPPATHTRPASCADVDCPHAVHGWATEVDETSTLGQMQAHYIRRESGRRFVEDRTPDGLTRFEFAAGQECFAEHRAPVSRPPVFLVRPGDARGNPFGTPARVHERPELWVEEMQENLDERMRELRLAEKQYNEAVRKLMLKSIGLIVILAGFLPTAWASFLGLI